MISPESLAASGTEHGHGAALACWCAQEAACGHYPELRWLTALPMGGQRHKAVAGKLKAEGAKAGLPDYVLALRRGPYAALWLELKRPELRPRRGGKGGLSDEQSEWIEHLRSQGHGACVVYGWIEAKNVIIAYLEQKDCGQ